MCACLCVCERRGEKRWKEKKREITLRIPFPSSTHTKAPGIWKLKKRGTISWVVHKQKTFNHQMKLVIPVPSAVSQEINNNVGKYFLQLWMHLLSHCLSWISLRCSWNSAKMCQKEEQGCTSPWHLCSELRHFCEVLRTIISIGGIPRVSVLRHCVQSLNISSKFNHTAFI